MPEQLTASPRTRGDLPCIGDQFALAEVSSPHARGSSTTHPGTDCRGRHAAVRPAGASAASVCQRPGPVWTQSGRQALHPKPRKIDAVVMRLAHTALSNSDFRSRGIPVPRAEAVTDLWSACFSDWRR